MRPIVPFAALSSLPVFLQFGAGGPAAPDPPPGLAPGFGTAEVGFAGSAAGLAHVPGVFIGCGRVRRTAGSVGPARACAAGTAAGTIGRLLHMTAGGAVARAPMRRASGIRVAGCRAILRARRQAKVTNAPRGRAHGIDRAADSLGSPGAQLRIGGRAAAAQAFHPAPRTFSRIGRRLRRAGEDARRGGGLVRARRSC